MSETKKPGDATPDTATRLGRMVGTSGVRVIRRYEQWPVFERGGERGWRYYIQVKRTRFFTGYEFWKDKWGPFDDLAALSAWLDREEERRMVGTIEVVTFPRDDQSAGAGSKLRN